MLTLGDTIENPITGERMTFLLTGMAVRPGGFVTSEHVHPLQEERFIVKTGQLTMSLAGQERQCTAGDEIAIPARTPHAWWNSGTEELRVLVEFRPAGRFDQFVRTFFALAHTGRTNSRGLPTNVLQLAVTFRAYSDVVYGTAPPLAVQKVLFWVLDPIGRLLGYRADVPYPNR
jgi:quercetin dioxygenase-like cupin family protein